MIYILEKGFDESANGLVFNPIEWTAIISNKLDYSNTIDFFNKLIADNKDSSNVDFNYNNNWTIIDMFLRTSKFETFDEWMIHRNIVEGIVPQFEVHIILKRTSMFPVRTLLKIIDLTTQTTLYENKHALLS